MTYWLIAGLCFIFATTLFMLFRWGNIPCSGPSPTKSLTFIAILFTSGLDVGLIMFPLTEFGMYANTTENPEYSFANPLAIEFGFWAFLIWTFYFMTCFYFCIIEPKVKFFEIPIVKFVNNIIIIGTCAFTGYLLLKNLPWYLPALSNDGEISGYYYLIVFAVVVGSVLTSMSIRAIRILSVSTTWFFLALIGLLVYGAVSSGTVDLYTYPQTIALVGEYFTNIHQFAFPMSDYHQFYLFWWLAWCIMIGQFTSRFAGGLRTYQLLLAMLVLPSVMIIAWFSILYIYHVNQIDISGMYTIAMVVVGVVFVLNSLDSLTRLYTDNLNFTVKRYGKAKYILGNILLLSSLVLFFQLDFLQIEWIGSIVIGIFFSCTTYILIKKREVISEIDKTLITESDQKTAEAT